MVVIHGAPFGLPMGWLAGYAALGLDSYSSIGTFITFTHVVKTYTGKGMCILTKMHTLNFTYTHKLSYMLVNRSACLFALSV